MTKLDQTVAEFRQKLADLGTTFFLVYTDKNLNNEDVAKITSNSSQQGIRAILGGILRPTNKALHLLATELENGARAAVTMSETVINQAKAEGAFTGAAAALFDHIRPWLTLVGWEDATGEAPGPREN